MNMYIYIYIYAYICIHIHTYYMNVCVCMYIYRERYIMETRLGYSRAGLFTVISTTYVSNKSTRK